MKGPRRMVSPLISSALLICSMDLSAQSLPPPRTAVPGFYHDMDGNEAAVRRGEAIFYQRCSLCHLPRIRKPRTTPGPAPSITGILKGADQERESKVREYIMQGGERMPGWQYSLKPAQIDDLMKYLKTL